MVGQPDYTPADMIADDLRAMAGALLLSRSGQFRPGTIAYLRGEADIWGEPSLWAELPPEVRAAMQRAAGDLAFQMPGAEDDAAAWLVRAADLLVSSYEAEVDASDFRLDFHPDHARSVEEVA